MLARTFARRALSVIARSRAVPAFRALSAPAGSSAAAAETHDDFKPKSKVDLSDPAKLKEQIDNIVAKNKVVLFMKGTPKQPQCGFSMRAVQVLQFHGAEVYGVDVLSNPLVRQFMKEYSDWPTFPQLYINGQFIGGTDITMQMHESGDLAKMLEECGAKAPLK